MNRVRIAPSLLSADVARLGGELTAVIEAGAHVRRVAVAGADTLVAGSAVFGGGACRRAIAALRDGAEGARR